MDRGSGKVDCMDKQRLVRFFSKYGSISVRVTRVYISSALVHVNEQHDVLISTLLF